MVETGERRVRREQGDELMGSDKGGNIQEEMSSTRREVDVPRRSLIEG
jgi:hypothetical protein